MHPALHKSHASAPRARAVFERAKVLDVQTRGQPRGFQFLVGCAHVAITFRAGQAIKCFCAPNELYSVAFDHYAAKIFALFIPRQSFVPRTGGFRQFPAHEPRARLHPGVFFHLQPQPFDRTFTGTKARSVRISHGWCETRKSPHSDESKMRLLVQLSANSICREILSGARMSSASSH